MRVLKYALLTAALVGIAQPAVASNWDPECELFFHWSKRLLPWQTGIGGCVNQEPFDYECGDLTRLPHPGNGHDWGPSHIYTTCTYDRLEDAGAPLGLLLLRDTVPMPYNSSGNPITGEATTLSTVLSHAPLDFVILDLEDGEPVITEWTLPNITAVANQLAAINPNARMGNYHWYPGNYDATSIWNGVYSPADRTARSNFYLNSELTIAMPSCYPYEQFSVHAGTDSNGNSTHWSGVSTPTIESAMFWAPLERLSTAARALPEDHLLIPWVASFIPWNGYEAPAPDEDTLYASIQHYRLRGAHGLSLFPGDESEAPVTNDEYIDLALDAWHELDYYFEDTESSTIILNLDTNKAEGVEWSGIQNYKGVVVLVSNLGTDPNATVNLPFIEYGVPSTIPAPLGHTLYEWPETCPWDIYNLPTPDGYVDSYDAWFLNQSLNSYCDPYGLTPENCYLDFNGDGYIDSEDYYILTSHFGPCP